MQCKVTCFTIAVDCSDFDYACFALLRMSLKVFAYCLRERNSRIRLYGDDGFDYVEVQIDFTQFDCHVRYGNLKTTYNPEPSRISIGQIICN